MKAPDKIYFDGTSSACSLPVFSSQNIVYIRKDALMEMLLTMEARHSVFYLEGKIVREVIDKINSL